MKYSNIISILAIIIALVSIGFSCFVNTPSPQLHYTYAPSTSPVVPFPPDSHNPLNLLPHVPLVPQRPLFRARACIV